MNEKNMRRVLCILGFLALIVLPLVFRNRYLQHVMVMCGIYVMLTSSWNILAGYSGLLNLGHAAFFGVGAYASALIVMHTGMSSWLGLFAGGAVSAVFGMVIGIPSFRLSGPYLAITTIGFSEILRMVAMNWVDLTRGSLGLYGIPPLTPFKWGSTFSIEFFSEQNYYYVVLFFVVVGLFALRKLLGSEFGVSLESMREDETGAESIGIDTARYKLAVFMLSAFMAGFAGALYAHYMRLISPEMLSLPETFSILTMAVVGGLGTLFGPVLGAVVLTVLSEGLRFVEDLLKIDIRLVLYGALLIFTILFVRNGLVGVFQQIGGWISRKPEA